jgi:hypothetical protein
MAQFVTVAPSDIGAFSQNLCARQLIRATSNDDSSAKMITISPHVQSPQRSRTIARLARELQQTPIARIHHKNLKSQHTEASQQHTIQQRIERGDTCRP